MESILFTTLTRNSFSMTSEGSGEQKCGGLMGEWGGGVYAMSGFYFMGTHWYWLPADTSLNLNSVTRSIDIKKPTSVCLTYLCSLSPARVGGGGEIAFRVGICNLSLFWNGNPLVSTAS
jgi:hypothetical protein